MNPIYPLIFLQALDVVTTWLCVRTGKAQETNPFLAGLFGALGTLPALILVKGGFVALLLWVAPQVDPVVLWLVCLGYVWVVYNNIKVLRALKAKA